MARAQRSALGTVVLGATATARKTPGLARLLKALLTFEGALDYGAWKLERHSGERLTITPRLRRFPWLFVWPELWRLWRAGRL